MIPDITSSLDWHRKFATSRIHRSIPALATLKQEIKLQFKRAEELQDIFSPFILKDQTTRGLQPHSEPRVLSPHQQPCGARHRKHAMIVCACVCVYFTFLFIYFVGFRFCFVLFSLFSNFKLIN